MTLSLTVQSESWSFLPSQGDVFLIYIVTSAPVLLVFPHPQGHCEFVEWLFTLFSPKLPVSTHPFLFSVLYFSSVFYANGFIPCHADAGLHVFYWVLFLLLWLFILSYFTFSHHSFFNSVFNSVKFYLPINNGMVLI